jgi:hypothetical protein
MVNTKDFWDYIFNDQIKRDLDVEKVSKDDQIKILADKKAKLKRKLTEKFDTYLDNYLFKSFVVENNPELANILYPDECKDLQAAQFKEEDGEWEEGEESKEQEEIIKEFHLLNQKYNFIAVNDRHIKLYLDMYKLVKFIDEIIEQNGDHDQLYLQTYKLFVIWDFNLVEIDNFLKSFYQDNQSPLHDALVFTLPETTSDILQWRNLIKKHGPKMFQYFARAVEIEAKLGGKAPTDIDEAANISSQLSYQRALENPKLAKIFNEYNIPEKVFEKVLSIELNRTVNQDNLPNLHLSGAELGEEYKGYHLCKLPKADVRGYILGEITACCQSVNNYAEECAIDGMTRENDGFYVLVKYLNNEAKQKANPFLENGEIDYRSFKIIGQAYAWSSIHGNLVFDSWENLDQVDDDKLVPLLKEFATKIVKEYKIGRVTIGSSGKTPQILKFTNPYNEVILEGHSYDSNSQWLLATSDILEQQSETFGVPIYSLKFAKELANNKSLLKKIKNLYEAGIPAEELQYLCSDVALKIYQKFEQFDPEWLFILAEEDVSILKSITSYAAYQIYIEQDITPEHLLESVSKNKDLLELVTSDHALKIIRLFPELSLKHLLYFAKFDIELLHALISPQAMRVYLLFQNLVKPQHLLDISANNVAVIDALTSEVAQFIYINCKQDPSSLWDIAGKRIEILQVLLAGGSEEFYKRFPMVDLRKIVVFANNNSELLGAIIHSRYLYQAFPDITPEKLLVITGLNKKFLEQINTYQASRFYQQFPALTLNQLLEAANGDTNTVALLVNSNIYHKFPTLTPFRLIEISKGNFELLNSILPQDYSNFYTHFECLTPEKLIEICDSNVEMIKVITDPKNIHAIRVYKDILEELPRIAGYDREKLQELLENIFVNNFKDLCKHFSSFDKKELIRISLKNPDLLKDLGLMSHYYHMSMPQQQGYSLEEILRISEGDSKIIRLMKNMQFYELCKTYSISPEQLFEVISDDDNEIIWALYSAKEYYSHFQVGPLELANLANCQYNIIQKLSNAISLYKELPSITPEILSFLFLNYPEQTNMIHDSSIIKYCKDHPTLPVVKIFKVITIFGNQVLQNSLSLEKLEDLVNSIELIIDDKSFTAAVSHVLENKCFLTQTRYTILELVQLSDGNHQVFSALAQASEFFSKYPNISPINIVTLANHDSQIIFLLTNNSAMRLYEKYHITPQDLLAISTGKQDVLSYLTASVQYPFSDLGPALLMQLSEGDSQLLKLMVSREIIKLGERFSLTLPELIATIERNKPELLGILCSDYNYYRPKNITDIELRNLLEICNYNGSILKLIISYDAARLFESYPELQLEEFVEIFADQPELFKDITSNLDYSIKSFLSKYSQISLKDIVKLSNYNKANLFKIIDYHAQEFYKRYDTIDIKKLMTIYQTIDGDIVYLLQALKLNPEQLFDEHKGDKNLIKASLYMQSNKLKESFPDLTPTYLLIMFNNNSNPIRRLTSEELLILTKIKEDLLPIVTEAYTRGFYQESGVTIEESLKAASNDPETLRVILSADAKELYKNLNISPSRLVLLSQPKNNITEIIEIIQKVDKDVGVILTSFTASKLYSSGIIDLCSLSALTSDKVVLSSLVSYRALKIYEHNPKITPQTLHLTSQNHDNLEEIISGLYNETQKSDKDQNLSSSMLVASRVSTWHEQLAANNIQNVARGYQTRLLVERLEARHKNKQAKET